MHKQGVSLSTVWCVQNKNKQQQTLSRFICNKCQADHKFIQKYKIYIDPWPAQYTSKITELKDYDNDITGLYDPLFQHKYKPTEVKGIVKD